MAHHLDDETVNRFTIAASELLRHDLDPEFAQDGQSVVFLAGPPLDADKFNYCAVSAEETKIDFIYLAFEPGRERFGPTTFSIFAERFGVVFTWSDCALWAPKDGGPLLVMPKGVNVCFAHDGKALLSLPTRPTQSLANGVARARNRLLRAARKVTQAQLDKVEYDLKRAA